MIVVSNTSPNKLDLGEIEALTLAQHMKADLLTLDDKRAQKEAKLLSIPYVSSFALLTKAYQKGFISNIQQTLKQLEKNYIFLLVLGTFILLESSKSV